MTIYQPEEEVVQFLEKLSAIHSPTGYKCAIFLFKQDEKGSVNMEWFSEVEEGTLRRWLRILLRTKLSDKQQASKTSTSVH